MDPSTSSTHGPAAFTTIRACALPLTPDLVSQSTPVARPPSTRIRVTRVWVFTSAPFAAASSAFSTTSRSG